MKVYLAGPMTGYPNLNFPAFDRFAARLRAVGYTVFNPAEKDRERDGVDWGQAVPSGDRVALVKAGFNPRVAILDDLTWIAKEADAVALMPGWEKSKGAQAEYALAVFLGLELIFLRRFIFTEG
jgi:hypothetical protein